MKILHSADWHVKDSSIEECRKCLGAMVAWAKENPPDLVVVAGDLTHRFDLKLDTQASRLVFDIVGDLSALAPVVILGGTPFHEGRSPELLTQLRRPNIYVCLDYPVQVTLIDGRFAMPGSQALADAAAVGIAPDAVLSLVPAPTKRFIEASGTIGEVDGNIAAGMGLILQDMGRRAQAWPTSPHIVVGHWSIGGAYTSETQQMIGRDIEISRDQVRLAAADLVLLGHIHKAQQIGTDPIFYSGSIYSLDAGELDPKGFFVHEIGNNGNIANFTGKQFLESRFFEVPATRRLVIEADLTIDDMDAGIDRIKSVYGPETISGNIVKITVRLFQDTVEQFKGKADIEAFFMEAGAAQAVLHLIRVPRDNVRCKEFFTLATLAEKIAQQAALRGEPPLDPGLLEKVSALESTPAEQLIADLPKP